jgi:hypothetical protein
LPRESFYSAQAHCPLLPAWWPVQGGHQLCEVPFPHIGALLAALRLHPSHYCDTNMSAGSYLALARLMSVAGGDQGGGEGQGARLVNAVVADSGQSVPMAPTATSSGCTSLAA